MLVLRKAHCPTGVSIPEGYKAIAWPMDLACLDCPNFHTETSKPGQLVTYLQPSSLLNHCGCLPVPTRHFSYMSHFASTARFCKAGLRDNKPQDHRPCVWFQGDLAVGIVVKGSLLRLGSVSKTFGPWWKMKVQWGHPCGCGGCWQCFCEGEGRGWGQSRPLAATSSPGHESCGDFC